MFGGRNPNIDRWAMTAGRYDGAKAEQAVTSLSHRPSILLVFRRLGAIIVNTAIARRLALGDRVLWMGENDRPPMGAGTITRITAHQIEVLWEGENARRYRRAQLYNLRHAPTFAGT